MMKLRRRESLTKKKPKRPVTVLATLGVSPFDGVFEEVLRSLKNMNDGSISCLPVCSRDFLLTRRVCFLLPAFPPADSLMKNVCVFFFVFFNTCTDGDGGACR